MGRLSWGFWVLLELLVVGYMDGLVCSGLYYIQ